MKPTESLEELLLTEMSRRNTDLVVSVILEKPELFPALFGIFCSNREPVSRRAAWAVDYLTEQRPDLILPYLDELTDRLPVFGHDGLKRHTLRILSRSPLPGEDRLAVLINLCFDWISSPAEAIAVKVYSMDLLFRISRLIPEITRELEDTIRCRMEEESAGYRSHGRKLLKKLYSRECD